MPQVIDEKSWKAGSLHAVFTLGVIDGDGDEGGVLDGVGELEGVLDADVDAVTDGVPLGWYMG